MKILVIPYNLLAHYLRSIELVKIIDIEAEILFLKSAKYDNFVETNGYKLTKDSLNTYNAVIKKSEAFDFSWINEKSVKETVYNLIDIIKTEKPDYILGDTYLGLRIAAEYCKTPLISILNAYLTHYYDDIRPVPHNHQANIFKPKLSKSAWEKIVRTVEKQTLRKVHSPFRKIRKQLELKPYNDLLDEFAGDQNLICDDPNIFPSKTLPYNYKYCGPLLYSCHKHNNKLLNFLKQNSYKKTILISMGSTGKISNLGKLNTFFWDKYNVVITGLKKEEQKANIYYTDFINFQETIQFIDLLICHGGNGTMYQAISNAIPTIAIPTIFEQEWNTYRFEKFNLCKVWFFENDIKLLEEMIENSISEGKNNETILHTYNTEIIKQNFYQFLKQTNQ